MSPKADNIQRVWTVAEAKARLSEVLRRSETEGPQRIGTRKAFIVVPAETLQALTTPRQPMGEWLVDNLPRGTDLVIPNRFEPGREMPFSEPSDE
ncbi:MAG: type II toxin-antitoxin system prevent-host-death family antitoxin [Gammaproteobacteria bacterium]|nr:type II toxin-antitoxin system prevent-host-death family antitoxin [Gammaproteobacteria bacterium]